MKPYQNNQEKLPKDSGSWLSFTPASPEGQVLTETGASPQILIRNYNETATDALGRRLLTSEEVGLPRKGKYVGLFYSIWTCTRGSVKGHIDVTKAYACNPADPDVGPKGTFCWWGEPETGYHRADDVWQIRRDMHHFAMAGIDFLFMDFTNARIYEEGFTTMLDTMLEMRAAGQMTPYIACWIRSNVSREGGDLGGLYEKFYKNEKYRDLWFYWDGKPLTLLKPNSQEEFPTMEDEELFDYFTSRICWTNRTHPKTESWSGNVDSDFLPEKPESVHIRVAGWAFPLQGRSGPLSNWEHLDQFRETPTMGEGIEFQRCFDKMLDKYPDTEVLRISTWNEWTAMSHHGGVPFGFADQFNAEFSRDIEPMKGGFTDNYFYQMCNMVRRFKGVLPADCPSAARTIRLDGDFAQWQEITPVFTDFEGDTSVRDDYDPAGEIHYVNRTGRNDIVESRLTVDGGTVYAYVRTAAPITSYKDGRNWMMLFIDADGDKRTGFEGYDFVVNYAVIDDKTTTLCAYRDGVWQEIGSVAYRIEGNEMMIAIPRSLLGLTEDTVSVNFHWLDNVTDVYDLHSWFTTGDSAPDRRNDYTVSIPAPYDAAAETLLEARTEGAIRYMLPAEVDGATLVRGLQKSVYRLPAGYGKMPCIDHIQANRTATEIAQAVTADADGYATDYALSYEGYVRIPEDGTYAFRLTADSGAILWVGGREIASIPYDAEQRGLASAEGSIRLAAGCHKLRIDYAEVGGCEPGLSLEGEWEFRSAHA